MSTSIDYSLAEFEDILSKNIKDRHSNEERNLRQILGAKNLEKHDIVFTYLNITANIVEYNSNILVLNVKISKLATTRIEKLRLSYSIESDKFINDSEMCLNESMIELLNEDNEITIQISIFWNFERAGKLYLWASGETYDNRTVVGSYTIYLDVNDRAIKLLSSTDRSIESVKKLSDIQFIEKKSPGNIIVYGYWYYEDSNGVYQPIRNALVVLYDDDLLGTTELARTYTDDSGYYEFPPIVNDDGAFEDGYDIWVAVYCENAIVKVTDGSPNAYWGRTDKIENVPDGYIDMGSWVMIDNPNTEKHDSGCWEIFENVNNIARWVYQQTGWIRDQVYVYWPSGDWPCTDGDIIYIPDGEWYADKTVVYHEYGHDIMYAAYGDRWPEHGYSGTHYIVSETDFGFALLEGWAEFMECVVDNDPNNLQDLGMNIENNDWYNIVDEGDLDGAYVEGSIASILWDIFDPVNDSDFDGLDMDFDDIFYTFLDCNPDNIHDFWEDFTLRYDCENELREIYYHYGINKGKKATWTFLIYMDGDNDLESAAIEDILEMSSIGSDKNISIVVLLDRIEGYDDRYGDWTGTKLFYITKGFKPYSYNAIVDMGELNMGDGSTLFDFVGDIIEDYPADHYALILWDHGMGYPGVCIDKSNSSDYLHLWEINYGLLDEIDIIGFDACLMSTIEVASTVCYYAEYMVASEEEEPGDGWPYDEIFDYLQSNPGVDPELLSKVIAFLYVQSYNGGSQGYSSSVTQSAIDLRNIRDYVMSNLSRFARELLKRYNEYSDEILNSIDNSEKFGSNNFIDVYDFAQKIYNSIGETSIKDIAQALIESIEDSVLASYSLEDHPNAHGLTISTEYYGYNEEYNHLYISWYTIWDELIRLLRDDPYDAWFYDIWVTDVVDDDDDGYYEAITLNWDVDTIYSSLWIDIKIEVLDLSDWTVKENITGISYYVYGFSSDDVQNIKILLDEPLNCSFLFYIYAWGECIYGSYFIYDVSDDLWAIPVEPDTQISKLEIISPENNSYIGDSSVQIVWSGEDYASGIDHYEIKVDDGDWLNVGLQTSFVVENLEEGFHEVMLKAYDQAGNYKIIKVRFMVDVTSPSLNITAPENNSYISVNSLQISWSGEDNASGIDHHEIKLDDGDWLNVGTTTSYIFADIGEDSHIILVKAVDRAGNEIICKLVVIIDRTPPSINIISPSENSDIVEGVLTVNWTASDNIGVKEIKIYLNGSMVAILSGVAESYSMEITTGTYNIKVVAVDHAGNENYDHILISVRKTSGGGFWASSGLLTVLALASVSVMVLFIVLLKIRKR